MLFIFIIVVIFLIAGLIASYFLFFKNKLTIKKNDFIQRKCSYLFFLINGKINEYIERLAYISKKNPFYIDKYNCFLSEFKVLTDESEKVNLILKDIQDSVYRKNFLEVRKKIFNNKKKILDFEKQVLEINNNLIKIFVSEEDQRQSFAILDKKIKNIQNFFINEKKNLVFFQNKYNFLFLIFKELQKKFEDFLDIGEFNESKKILKKIDVFVKNFENFNNVITDIYIILSEINSKIPIFEKKFTSLIKEGHDLYKLVFEHILFVKNNLINVFRRIKLLKLEKIKEDLLLINNKIDELYDLLNKEKNASENFLKELEIVDKQIYFLEYFFNNFCILFNQISKIYILEKNDIFNFNNLKKKISIIKSLKKTIPLEKNQKKCYFFILKKINNIKENIVSLNEEIFFFEKSIVSIRNDAEKFFILVYDFYFRLKKIEKMIFDSEIDCIYKKYEQKINEIYSTLNETMNLLTIIPINMKKIHNIFNNYLNLEADSFINKINNEISLLNSEEKTVLYLNRTGYDNAIFIEENIKDNFFNDQSEKVLVNIKKILNK